MVVFELACQRLGGKHPFCNHQHVAYPEGEAFLRGPEGRIGPDDFRRNLPWSTRVRGQRRGSGAAARDSQQATVHTDKNQPKIHFFPEKFGLCFSRCFTRVAAPGLKPLRWLRTPVPHGRFFLGQILPFLRDP